MEKILSYYIFFVWEQRKLIGHGLARNTHKTYLSRAKNFRDYLKSIGKTDLHPSEMNIRMIRSFDIYLRSTKKHCNDYVMRNIQMLKRMLDLAVDDDMIQYNPATRYKFKYTRKQRKIFLNLNQLTILKNYPMPNKDLERVRDMFLFSCYTSLSYIEVKNFKKSNLIRKGGEAWLKVIRQKTTVGSTVLLPLISGAEEILKKYGYDLPVSSNQCMNKSLKRISQLTKIDLPLTTHSGRKTFGNILLNDFGVDLKSVSIMMGHESVLTTEKWYIEVSEKKIKRDMREVMAITW
jgi:integrase/recombinase XerD